MILEFCKIGMTICLWEVFRQVIKESQPGMAPWFFSNEADPEGKKKVNGNERTN